MKYNFNTVEGTDPGMYMYTQKLLDGGRGQNAYSANVYTETFGLGAGEGAECVFRQYLTWLVHNVSIHRNFQIYFEYKQLYN